MFNKKNDPLVESVKAVMKQNEVHRQAEAALNEELGISSKKALPHEYHEAYDRALQESIKEKLKENKPISHPNQSIISKQDGDPKSISSKDLSILRNKKKAGIAIRQEEANVATTGKHPVTPAEGAKPAGKLEEKATEAQKEKIHKVMGEFKRRKLHSGSKKGPTVTSRDQAVAIALNQAGLSKKKMNEAEGDVNPSEMTPISKGLQDRIVKDPPKPKPETKQMNEASYGGKLVAAIRKQREMSADPDVDLKPKPANLSLGAREMVKRGAKLSMAESVIDEIRENLEANLIAIHESGDDELFENYILSLTEEELQILGLNERDGDPAATSRLGRALASIGLQTPSYQSAMDKRQTGAAMGDAGQPAPTPKTPTPNALTQHRIGQPSVPPIERRPEAKTPNPATSLPARDKDTSPAPEAPATSLPARDKDTSPAPEAPAATQRQTPAVTTQQTPRPAPERPKQDNVTRSPFGGARINSSSGSYDLSLEESVKPQIKESLESFLRNRFLKG